MDSSRLLGRSTLSVACPHCGQADSDVWEAFGPDSLHRMRCAQCRAEFSFALLECPTCGEETLFTWNQPRRDDVLASLTCLACGRGHEEHE